MKLLVLIGLGAVGFVLLRRRRPELAQRLEGKAKDAAGQLNGDQAMRVEGKAKNLAGRLRGKARGAVS
jgi:uncharacterized protein YjbJ (UPF0337 family)